MADVEIPKRALFKASEVCEIASVQPYVLRSWESEFPDLGVAKGAGAPRIYRRSDVEKVLRIKQLVFTDGLTLAGVRRRIEEEAAPVIEEATSEPMRELLGRNAKERLAAVKKGLIDILEMLGGHPGDVRRHVTSPVPAPATAKAVSAARSTPSAATSRKPVARSHKPASRSVSKPAKKRR